ncbi:hypothetical protein NKI63_12705 [Mesorhizobium sp. M0410]|uniref:hypothetical protein n=1 Tax=Mesorhizobium sp. M0410 TaxID=2956943 RepID=UPI00333A7F13
MSATILRMGDLSRWSAVKSGDYIKLDGRKVRTVRLDLRASDYCLWFVERADEDGVVNEEFLCLTPAGNSTIELLVADEMRLVPNFAKDGHLLFSSPEFDFIHVDGDPESFTKIAHRRARNPEVEYMHFMMNQNMEARMAVMEQEMERRMAGITKGLHDGTNLNSEDGLHQRPATQREKLQKAAGGGGTSPAPDGLSGGLPQPDTGGGSGTAPPASDGAPDLGAA